MMREFTQSSNATGDTGDAGRAGPGVQPVALRLTVLQGPDCQRECQPSAPPTHQPHQQPIGTERLAQWSERLPELGGEQLRLLPRREVAAPVDLVEVDKVR